jgi:hypothetical protein
MLRGSKSFWRGWLERGLACTLAISGATTTTTLAPNDLLPDLVMAEPQHLSMIGAGNGVQMLRFGTIVWNIGDAPLEIRASQREGRFMQHVEQWVTTVDGSGHGYVPTGTSVFYSGDGHNHWHVQDFLVVNLYPAPDSNLPLTNATRALRKIGYCLEDTHVMADEIKPANAVAHVHYPACGDSTSRDVVVGISVGWGDEYAFWLRHQSVAVDGLPSGKYRLCLSVNVHGSWLEKNANIANNYYWQDLQLDMEAGRVTVLGEAPEVCSPPQSA